MDSPLRKLVWMVVAVAAMVLLAPLGASAHEGHPAPRASLHVAAHHQDDMAHVDRLAAGKPAGEEAAQPGSAGDPDHDGLCTAGCCFGMGCCGGTIVSATPALDPPLGAPARAEHTPPPLTSAGLTSLLEPPTTFA